MNDDEDIQAEKDTLDTREYPDPSDMDQDDDVVLSRCPYCKKMIAEDSEVCPRCGNFINVEDSVEPGRFPLWFFIGLGLVLLVLIFGYLL